MLFGLPPRQRNFYRPKTSGKMGGRMTVYHPKEGDIIIERFDEVKNGSAVCFTSNGKVHDEAWLQQHLNGINAETYQSIFSFSALDLAEIRHMKDEDLGEVLLGIGLTGSNSIYSIEKKLDTKIGELFKPSGKKPLINQQIESLQTILVSLQSFRETEASYRNKKEAFTKLESELIRLQQDIKKESAKAKSNDKQLQAFPLLQDYHQLQSKLATYPETISFPENGVERLEKWKESLLPLQSEWNVLKENEQTYIDKINVIEQNLYSESVQEQAKTLLENGLMADSQVQELNKVKNMLHDTGRIINEEIDRLNIGMQIEDLENVELPFYLENTWNQIRSEHEQLKLEKEQITDEYNQLKQERNYLLNQVEQLQDNLLTDNQVDELHNRVNIFNEYHILQKLSRESETRKSAWNKSKATKEKRASSILTGSMLLALLSGIGAIVTDVTWAFALMVIAIVFGFGQWLMTKRSVREMNKMFHGNSKPYETEVTEAEKLEAESLLEHHHKNKNELTVLQEQEKLAEIQFIKWKEKKRKLDEKVNRIEQQIDQQYEYYPYLKRVEITFWPEFFHRLNQLLKMDREQQSHALKATTIEQQLMAFYDKVDRFLEDVVLEPTDKSDGDKLDIIRKMVKVQADKLHELEHYHMLLSEIKDKYQDLNQQIQTYKNEIKYLYEFADVDTDEIFYYKARQSKEKSDLKIELEKTIFQLTKILPQKSISQSLEKMITEEELELIQQQTMGSLEMLEEELEKVRDALATVKAELAAMESSESYSNSLYQYEMEKEQLERMAREWSVLKTAKEMLSETKRDYRDKYLTRVIEVTTKYFREITGNIYTTVYAPTENSPFQVETSQHIRYTVNELSQGTIDQLYISLRLAISEIMSDDNGLPFIIDDAFVHFDAIRTERMLEILNQTAKKQQVIFFTCKKEIAENISGMKRIDLTGKLHV